MATLAKFFENYLKEMGDPRVENWPLMKSPGGTLAIIGAYLALVYVVLPAYMKDRKPYSLKTVIYYYNLFQIAACSVLIYGISTSGWTTEYSFACQPVDYSERPIAVRMLTYVYYTFLLKLIELVETIFFLLRKKNNQVSNLHVYHHSSTAALAWIATKFIGGGMTTFAIILNSFIHILMYSYYWLSALGPHWQKKLAKWKPRLTMAQMIQFCILIVHSLSALQPSCTANKKILLLYLPNVVLIFYMFWNFYKVNYLKMKRKSV
ncbi:elongation of very long chain fatty acids protein AAEL008004 [Aethina tumida]|uniref:elongation of very long chain fatty acids protein AAEL008004 n=1 Tax=Aethina tumida TaxID=116153 RepID=UPI00096B140E|nr:elongation of very long chain fatty acids protein AAEL008004 [Aethina tumida]